MYEKIPDELKDLIHADLYILRPFDIHTGAYVVKPNGYRQKTSLFQTKPCVVSIEDKIRGLPRGTQKERCKRAFKYLMSSPLSSYSHFKHVRDQLSIEGKRLNMYDMERTKHIECALWPNLYPFMSWCESGLDGKDTRLSGKRSFWLKICSEIIDYSTEFELLQYQFDRWMFKVVSGAISTAQISHCSAAKALEEKPFSASYWQWQHRYLLDAVRQHGPPSVFVTISPYEWTFPFPIFVQKARERVGKPIQSVAVLETVCIAHALEQIVRGYLCGSNTAKWSNNVFSYNNMKNTKNVLTYFYRFEFQGRGTCHLHMLVWLKDITKMQLSRVKADIPKDNASIAFEVYRYQKSDKPAPFLKVQNNKTYCTKENQKVTVHLQHPPDAFAVNLRAYIDTLVPSLKCSMDFQTSDGHGMILRYVSSYVSKWHDAVPLDALYCFNLSGRQAAFRYLTCHQPCEPEMALTISPIKVAWTNSNTKKYTVPSPSSIETDRIVLLYWKRHRELDDMCLLHWLRNHTIQGQNVKPYKCANTLVGVKYVSVFNSLYFFQYIVMNKAHRCTNDLCAAQNADFPEQLVHYANACLFFPDLWNDDDRIQEMFILEGNTNQYVKTILSYVASMRNAIHLIRRQVVSSSSFAISSSSNDDSPPLSRQQQIIVDEVMESCRQKSRSYTRGMNSNDEEGSSEDEDETAEPEDEPALDTTWRNPIVVTGKPGAGKTRVILESVKRVTEAGGQVLITTPTGYLTSVLRERTSEEVVCDTVHAAFHYPVRGEQYPRVNYDLARYDLIVVDEISMISINIFHHILHSLSCLPFRPVLLACGDDAQMQPFSNSTDRKDICNILSDRKFLTQSRKHNLTNQFRILHSTFQKLLDKLRYWTPSDKDISLLSGNRILLQTNQPTEEDIQQVMRLYSDHFVLTYTKAAAIKINRCIISWYCRDIAPLAILQLDWADGQCRIFPGMAIVFTQNRHKDRGIVNGQRGIIKHIHNSTVFVQIGSRMEPVYPVTKKKDCEYVVQYPFMPAYALTICKAQGQTLDNVILWLDIDNIAPGAAYVAVSRVRSLDNLKFLCPICKTQFKPVTLVR